MSVYDNKPPKGWNSNPSEWLEDIKRLQELEDIKKLQNPEFKKIKTLAQK